MRERKVKRPGKGICRTEFPEEQNSDNEGGK